MADADADTDCHTQGQRCIEAACCPDLVPGDRLPDAACNPSFWQ